MPTRLSTRQLRDAMAPIQTALGVYWTLRIILAKDDDNWFDPPVAYIEARIQQTTLLITADGEVVEGNSLSNTEFELGRGWTERALERIFQVLRIPPKKTEE